MQIQRLADTVPCTEKVFSTQSRTPYEREIEPRKRQHKEYRYDTEPDIGYAGADAADLLRIKKARKKCSQTKAATLNNSTTKNIPPIDFFQYLYHIMEFGMIELTVLVVAM